MKAINHSTANEFHDWQARALYAHGFRMQDLDAWAIAVTEPASYAPVALVELKRSFILPSEWFPFAADRAAYASLLALAEAAAIPLFVVYFVKGEPIRDDSLFHVFEITAAIPEYHGRRRLMRADAFAAAFPYPFNGNAR